MPRRRPPRSARVALVLLVLAACGEGDAGPVEETSANLSELRSGTPSLRLAVEGPEDGPVGFELDGAFSLPEEGGLPTAELDYTRLLGDETETMTFLADGERAVVVTNGGTREVDEAGLARLEVAGAGDDDVFDELAMEEWLDEVTVSPGPQDDGEPTERVTASLDAGAALRDLLETARRFGAESIAGLEGLEDATEETIRNAVRDSSFELVTGAEDRLLRALEVSIEFGVPPELGADLEELDGLRMTLVATIEAPNRPVPEPTLP